MNLQLERSYQIYSNRLPLPSQISAKRPCNGWQKKDGANSSKQKLKFATFNPRTSKFFVKFGRHIKPRVVKAFCKKYY